MPANKANKVDGRPNWELRVDAVFTFVPLPAAASFVAGEVWFERAAKAWVGLLGGYRPGCAAAHGSRPFSDLESAQDWVESHWKAFRATAAIN